MLLATADVAGQPGHRRGRCGQEIRRDDVVHVREVPRLGPVSVDDGPFSGQSGCYEPGDGRRILGRGILAGPEDVEVPQGDGFDPMEFAQIVELELGGQFARRIRR